MFAFRVLGVVDFKYWGLLALGAYWGVFRALGRVWGSCRVI